MDSFKFSYKMEKEDNILMNVYSSGYQKCEGGYAMGPIIRNHYLIHHVVSGKGYYTVNHQTYEVCQGDTFIIYPDEVVSYCADKLDPWEYYWVGFSGADAKALLKQTDFQKKHPVIRTLCSEELKQTLLNIYHCSGTELYHHVSMAGYLFLFLSILIRCSQTHDHSVDISMEYVRQAVNFISEHYEQHITITDVADHLGISRSHLYRVFIKNMAQSPKEYLEHYRVKQGCVLLEKTSMTINEISNLIGYTDPLHFSKVFKKQLGISPKGYRKNKNQKTNVTKK